MDSVLYWLDSYAAQHHWSFSVITFTLSLAALAGLAGVIRRYGDKQLLS